jgi:hypothetical protein
MLGRVEPGSPSSAWATLRMPRRGPARLGHTVVTVLVNANFLALGPCPALLNTSCGPYWLRWLESHRAVWTT